MATLIQELTNILQQQHEVYSKLLNIASQKKVAIIENNLPNLQKIIEQENLVIGKNFKLDKKREEIFFDIANVLNIKDVSLAKIIDAVKNQDGYEELVNIKKKLEDVLPKLKVLNDQNQELVKMSMEYIDYSINLIRLGTTGKSTYYDGLGNEIYDSENKMFDKKQ